MRAIDHILFRIARFQSVEKFCDAVQRTAQSNWKADFDKASKDGASAIQKNYRNYLETESERLIGKGGEAAVEENLAGLRTQVWAAHFLPVPLYQHFFRANLLYPFRWGGPHTLFSKKSVDHLRDFPFPKKQTPNPKKANLETVDHRALRTAWQESAPLVTYQDDPQKIEAVLASFTADDLHALAHGESEMDGPIVEAVAKHPNCDWGSALEILHSFSADAYQSYWERGQTEDDFGEVDHTLFRAFEAIAERAERDDFHSSRFKNNMRIPQLKGSDGQPNPNHPANWLKWSISENQMQQTSGAANNSTVVFEGGKVLLTFDAWKRRNGSTPSV